MATRFSNDQTSAVYDFLVEHDGLHREAVHKAHTEPASVSREVRSWVKTMVDSTIIGSEPLKDLLHATLRTVRWEEIRAELQREPLPE